MGGKALNLTGQRFGMLTALTRLEKTEDRYCLWECLCDCGKHVQASTKKLLRGTITNCGCIPKDTARRGSIPEDITGQRFGKLTAIRREPSKNRKTRWLCACDCGGTRIETTSMLKSGRTWCCGCETKRYEHTTILDLRGRRFGRLLAVSVTDKRDGKGSVFWKCQCDCGNISEVTADSLIHGNTISCGCRKQEIKNHIGDQLTFVEDTCIEWLRSRKSRSDNTSGFRGVYRHNGKWRVSIGLQKKRYYCGTYDTFEEAKAVRVKVEGLLHDGFVQAWEMWSAKAESDPIWAKENPFTFEVDRINNEIVIYAPIFESKSFVLGEKLSERK